MKAIRVTLKCPERTIVVNEDQVAYVDQIGRDTILHINGEELIISSPTYDDWENYVFER